MNSSFGNSLAGHSRINLPGLVLNVYRRPDEPQFSPVNACNGRDITTPIFVKFTDLDPCLAKVAGYTGINGTFSIPPFGAFSGGFIWANFSDTDPIGFVTFAVTEDCDREVTLPAECSIICYQGKWEAVIGFPFISSSPCNPDGRIAFTSGFDGTVNLNTDCADFGVIFTGGSYTL